MSYFKIVYKTTQNELYELVIQNAFDFVANAENIALVNTAANNILTANAIEVVLTFGGIASNIVIPYETLMVFANPATGFALTFPAIQESQTESKQPAEIIDLFARKK